MSRVGTSVRTSLLPIDACHCRSAGRCLACRRIFRHFVAAHHSRLARRSQ